MGARGTKPKENLAAATAGKIGVLPLDPPEMRGGREAAEEYRRLAAELTKLGHLNALHVQSLVNYCEAWEIARNCLQEINDDGPTLESGETGNKYMHPALSAWSMARGTMEKEAKNLGMTPLSLQSIKTVKPQKNAGSKEGPSRFLPGADAADD